VVRFLFYSFSTGGAQAKFIKKQKANKKKPEKGNRRKRGREFFIPGSGDMDSESV
jgi:hypothetical protein